MSESSNPPAPFDPPKPLFPHPAPQSGPSAERVVLIVLAVVGLIILLTCGGIVAAGYYAYANARSFGADLSRRVIVDVVKQSQLKEKDKRIVTVQVDRVVAAYKAGRISLDDVGRVMEELGESPLFVTAMVEAAQVQYVAPSALSEAEKAEARLTLERVARGLYEKAIFPESLDPALDQIAPKDAQGNRQFKERVSEPELREFLARCDQIADQAQVPNEPFQVDIGQEFRKAVDRALAGK